MNRILRYKKPIAIFFLVLFGSQLVLSNTAYALTTGPSQPEMKGFEPVGTADMVDLFSGDFTYNIPLLDVGGYPVNMAYHSGSGMDDEASWVGLGWSLNPGVINRQMRGIPDDFNGDPVLKEFNMKNNTTAGLKLSVTPEFFGFGRAKIGINAGVFKNSYRGYGGEVGVNATVGLTNSGSGTMTAGLNSNSQSGVDVSASVNFAMEQQKSDKNDVMPGLTIGSSYNSRAGIKGLTLTASADQLGDKNSKGMRNRESIASNTTSFSFASPSYTPGSPIVFNNQSYTLSGSLGPVIVGIFGKVGFTGYYVKQSVANKKTTRPSYGSMHSEKGRNDVTGLMDFNREKDMPYNAAIPYLPIPVPTYDLFNVSNQSGSNQYRVYRNGTGIFADPKTEDRNIDASVGVELGVGGYFQAGVDVNAQSLSTRTNKWSANNDYRAKGDFQDANAGEVTFEPSYFKRVGEKGAIDTNYTNLLQSDKVAGVNINLSGEKTKALSQWRTKDGLKDITQPIRRKQRESRNHVLSYLTANEAGVYGLDKKISNYPLNTLVLDCNSTAISQENRVNTSAKAHHISEITVLDDKGGRVVYGIPAYNKLQEEVSFSADPARGDRNTGLVGYSSQDASPSNTQGREGYYSKESMPPFAHSYLMTGVISNDYVDITGNGISDDDPGSAVKFNYSKLAGDQNWRTPYDKDKANYNENMRSDKRDDKGSYVYGSKEIWYTHSIESKTMIALFITQEREDGLGVVNSTGGKDETHKQRYLERIELYSKSDLKQNGTNAIPVKTVHFEYDYSSCPGVSNNSGKEILKNGENVNALKGKLTLKKVYFTFGKNGRGVLQPYKFSYAQKMGDELVNYGHKQADRWGMYKNNSVNEGALNNDEYPYSTQNKEKADAAAALWQMDQIEIPGGGIIKVNYESDDYAYVQDQRSAEMCFVKGIDNAGQNTGLINAKKLLIKLPKPVTSLADMKARYFEGMKNLYFRMYVNLDNAGHYEYVPGYGTISSITMVDNQTAAVELSSVEGAHPAALAAWQFFRMNLPIYAYPGSETTTEDSDFKAAIKSLLTAIQQLPELTENFNTKSRRKNYGNQIDLSRSWVRLCSPSFAKMGGGSRVKSVRMSDNWKAMSGVGEDASYGQDYDYTTTNRVNGQDLTISSGVATYEPMIGADENPFRQPFPYTVKGAPLGLNSYSYLEAPLGETFFPSPGVGYSKVTVYTVGADNSRTRSGFEVNDFYTAKDFPVIVDKLPIDPKPYKPNPLLNFLKMKFKSGVVVSQGYSIDVNDMHGKQKRIAAYKRGAISPLSSTEYLYKMDNPVAGKKLDNNVLMMHPDGSLRDEKAGIDVEMFTDMREQYTQNIGGNLHLSFGSFPIIFFPGAYVFPGVGFNQEYREFRSSSTVKLIQRAGILYKINKIQDGSALNTENIAWDPVTGEALLSKTQNEFDDPVYKFNYPAYWAYDGMGQSYKNIGITIKGFSTDISGRFLTAVPSDILLPGDEVISINTDQKAWVMKGGDGLLKMIDKNGVFVKYDNATIKIARSGRRNILAASVGALVALRNPVRFGKLDIGEFTRVIDVSAGTYKEEWPVALQGIEPDLVNQPADTLKCPLQYITGLLYAIADPTLPFNSMYVSPAERKLLNEQYLFAGKQSNVMLKNIIDEHRSFAPSIVTYPLSQYFTEPFFKSTSSASLKFYVNHPRYRMKCGEKYYYFNSGDTITLGSYVLVLTKVHPYLNDAINGYPWLNSDGTTGYYTGNQNYYTKDSCGCNGVYGYDDTQGQRIELATHHFADISLDALGCKITAECPSPVGAVVNPYRVGMLGNWRPWQQYAYNVSRQQNVNDLNNAKGATDIRNSGSYASFTPFWSYNATNMKLVITGTAADERWTAINEVTLYNSSGDELENKDALNLYKSALIRYNNTLPTAITTNAMHHEIAFDGFEDYQFEKKCGVWADSCSIEGHFDFLKQVWYAIEPVTTFAHTGKYSLKINKPVAVNKVIPAAFTSTSFAKFDAAGHFIAANDNTYRAFYPVANKRYIASVWIKSSAVNNQTKGILQINVNTSQEPIAISQGTGPQVEGWRKVDVQFTVPDNAGMFSLTLDPKGGEAYFDDVRIHPYNGLMKSYVYNPSNLALMAQLDENNYAVIYEYDDEGTLIRIKKETENGIMTVKENRSIYKQH
jgi:hypothetical protein